MKFDFYNTPHPLGERGVRNMTFNGKYYFFTIFGQDKILQTTSEYEQIRYINTNRIYECITFDTNTCTFYATVQGCCSRIFQLNHKMEEISTLCLPAYQGIITGLSHQICDQVLWISYPWGIVCYRLEDGVVQTFPDCSINHGGQFISSILSLCPALLFVKRQKNQQYLEIYFENGTKIKEIQLPRNISVKNILYYPCNDTPRLEFLYTESCYPKISRQGVTAHDLGFEPCFCHGKICENICCPSFDQCVDEVLESIALVECSLSSILNTQGEQLQKIIAESDSIEEILCANEKVNETITKVTHLEMILHNKLESLSKLCPQESCKNHCKNNSGNKTPY